jgi:uncharacterized protein DUF4160
LTRGIADARTLDDLADQLEKLINCGCYVWIEPDGTKLLLYGRALVDRIDGLKIHIYADEHSPPHFHVRAPGLDCAFSLADCSLVRGSPDRKTGELIEFYHGRAKEKLVAFWNETRPTDCPVGPVKI